MKIYLLLLLFLLKNFSFAQSNRQVTHEDIREAILSMVHLIRDTTDKLERHELRERQLADQLKKALSSLDKRERNQDHLLNGIITKLVSVEDRIRNIENAMSQDEAAKGTYTVESAMPIPPWISNLEDIINKQGTLGDQQKLDAMTAIYSSKMDYLASLVEKLQAELLTNSARMAVLFEQHREHQLDEHGKWHDSILQKMEQQSNKLAEIQYNKPNSVNNKSMTDELLSVKDDVISIINSGLNKMENKITQLDYTLHSEEQNIIDTVSKNRDMMEGYFRSVNEKFVTLSEDVNALEKVEKILIQTDENIIDAKRKIEFMMFQIIKGVEDSISFQSKSLNDSMNGRFNTITDLIVDNQNTSMANVSGKIEVEMEQVWRQINMLYTQLTQSTAVLNNLLNQSQSYMNDSNIKMEKMDTRIDSINSHVADVHENVNYFMGRLALITQEFKQTRNALAVVVENLKIDVDKPKEDKDVGPGPIPIDSSNDPNLDNRL